MGHRVASTAPGRPNRIAARSVQMKVERLEHANEVYVLQDNRGGWKLNSNEAAGINMGGRPILGSININVLVGVTQGTPT